MPTQSTCPDAVNPRLTWQSFGYGFMCHYCTNCHDSSLGISKRNGAPALHDLDTLLRTMEIAGHSDEQAAWGPAAHNNFMPGAGTSGRCPSQLGGALDMDCLEPTEQERRDLGEFLACEKMLPADLQAPDADVSDHCAAYHAN